MGMLSAARKEQLKNALFTDFDYQSLEEMLSGPTVDKQIKAYASENDNLREAVALLVSGAEEEGWTLQLIQGAYEARKAPATEISKWVRRLFAEFAITVEGDSITQVQWSSLGQKLDAETGILPVPRRKYRIIAGFALVALMATVVVIWILSRSREVTCELTGAGITLRSGPGMSYDALPLELRPGERVVAVEYSPIAYEMERRVGQPWLKIKLADNSEGWIQLEDRVDCGYPPQDAAVRLSSALPAPTSILATPTPRATSTPTSAPTDTPMPTTTPTPIDTPTPTTTPMSTATPTPTDTPTRTPTSTLSPTPAPNCRTKTNVWVKAGPGTIYPGVVPVPPKTNLIPTARSDGAFFKDGYNPGVLWINVRVPDSGKAPSAWYTGWISGSDTYVECNIEKNSLPLGVIPSTPTPIPTATETPTLSPSPTTTVVPTATETPTPNPAATVLAATSEAPTAQATPTATP